MSLTTRLLLLLSILVFARAATAQEARDVSSAAQHPDSLRRTALSGGYSLVLGCIDGAERIVLLHGSDTIRRRRIARWRDDVR